MLTNAQQKYIGGNARNRAGGALDSCSLLAPFVYLLQDMRTYFLNLSQANAQDNPHWELEYRLTEAYGVPDASVRSMQAIATSIAGDQDKLQRYYVYNSVSYDTTACGETCRTEFLCATQEVDFDAYDTCLRHTNASPRLRGLLVLLALLLGLRALLAP